MFPTAWAVLAALTCPSALHGQEIDESKALKVKAAYLYNFAKFVRWPGEAFSNPSSPFVIGVLGDDPFGSILDRTVRAKKIAGRPITIQRFRWSREKDRIALTRCHILFISGSLRDRLKEILNVLQRHPVLVVSDIVAFAKGFGLIGLVQKNGRIVFEINREALSRTGLKASSKLLKLATIVKPSQPGVYDSAKTDRRTP